jgi:hypothetical protein
LGYVRKRRKLLNGANRLTALNSRRRQIPKGAKFQTALNSKGRNGATDEGRNRGTASRREPPFAHLRRLGFRAVWDFAPFGISRRLEFSAVWNLAPSGFSRRLCFHGIGILYAAA